MSTFTPSELNFSDSAINHFSEMISSRGKGVGVKIGEKQTKKNNAAIKEIKREKNKEE